MTTITDHWAALQALAGTFMNGGGQTVSLVQDDITRKYGIRVGDAPTAYHHPVRRSYWGKSFEAALEQAFEHEPKE